MAKRTRQVPRPRRNAQGRLKRFWRQFNATTPPYLHPQDIEYIGKDEFNTLNYAKYQASIGEIGNSKIHAGLLPGPFHGNLSSANVFVLTLNPGVHPIGYYAETRDRALRQALLRELHQELLGEEHPFTFLNPQFCYYAGFTYWEGRLQKVLKAVTKGGGLSYRKALKFVSRRLAVVQLLPYHSKDFRHGQLLDALPSVAVAQDFAAELLNRAKRDEITVIVVRRPDFWGFQESDESNSVVVYGSKDSRRGGHLNDRAVAALRRRWRL